MSPLAIPCPYCNSRQGEECRQGGDAWPTPAHRAHRARVRRAGLIQWWDLHGRAAWQQMEARDAAHS